MATRLYSLKIYNVGPVMGAAIGCFGLQIISTNIYAYITDVSHYELPIFVCV